MYFSSIEYTVEIYTILIYLTCMDPDAPMIFHILFYSCVFAAKFFSFVPQRRSKETGARKRICDTGSESVEVDKSVFTYLFTISCLSCMPVRLLSLYYIPRIHSHNFLWFVMIYMAWMNPNMNYPVLTHLISICISTLLNFLTFFLLWAPFLQQHIHKRVHPENLHNGIK